MTIVYVAAVADDDGAVEAVKRRILCRADERLQLVRPATESELKGLRAGAVRNLH